MDPNSDSENSVDDYVLNVTFFNNDDNNDLVGCGYNDKDFIRENISNYRGRENFPLAELESWVSKGHK